MRKMLGIIGNSLGHSLSPDLHRAAIEKLSETYTYDKWELTEDELESFIKSVKKANSDILGFNVTIPYKEKIIQYLDELDIQASKLKAVNTVKYENGILKGYNTDGLGLFESLKKNKVQYKEKNILILGNGGACKGIALFLTNQMVAEIDIAGRDLNKVLDLTNIIRSEGTKSNPVYWTDLMNLDLNKYHIIIQTTPLGMENHSQEISFPYGKLNTGHTVIDIVYNPLETDFLNRSKNNGAKCINGLEMLVYQGYHSFKIWTELDEDTELMLKTGYSLLEG